MRRRLPERRLACSNHHIAKKNRGPAIVLLLKSYTFAEYVRSSFSTL
jgi:hypothetical protein